MQENFYLQASAAVAASASGAGVVPTFTNNSGFITGGGTHTAVGVYNLDLDQPLAAADAVIIATGRSALADVSVAVGHVSDTRKQVTVGTAGAASDAIAFDIAVFRRPAT